jgi:long-chain acyl-CoA synthetase
MEGSTPVALDPSHHLTTRLWERAARPGGDHILRYPTAGGWAGMSWSQLADRVRRVAAGLIAAGIEPGDRVALMSGTRIEWTIADLAILSAGAVTVPIYETSSDEQCAWILADSGAALAICETADHAKVLDAARDRAQGLGEVFAIDDGGLDALAERGGADHRDQVAERAAACGADDVATIIYTSGTTGNPKGCVLTHGNLLWTARQSDTQLQRMLGRDDSTLLFLPLAHSFARLIQFLCLEAEVTLGFARSVTTVAEDIASFRPTFLLSVPRVFEKVFNAAQAKATGAKAKVFDFAVRTAAEWADGRRGPGVAVKHRIADRLVYAKLRAALGGRIRYCVSGGAPLAPHLLTFFHAAGITILEGYGLTETSAPATCNTPEHLRLGTVGQPLPGVEIKITDDGEVLIRGGNVFTGYYHNDDATREAFTGDGWFRSGDIGELDADGYLRITGRKKELIVTAGGKNVAPAVLEERLKAHRLVSQAMVVGDNRAYVACLVTVEPEEAARFDGAIEAEIAKAVEHANQAVSKAESIRRWTVLERDFTIEDGELTPTLKLRRAVVAEHFADEIEGLYA